MHICKLFWISGRVQGVCYRAFAQQQASQLEVSGYARNLEDGRVQILACGEAEAVAALAKWLWQGPPHARVVDIQTETITYREINGFKTS